MDKGIRTRWNRDRVRCELEDFMQRHTITNRFPTQRELFTLDRSPRYDLFMAIYRHGGPGVLAQALEVPAPARRPANPLLHSSQTLIEAVRAFARDHQLQRMPRVPELREAKRGDLLTAINRAGGFHVVGDMAKLPVVHPRAKPTSRRRRKRWSSLAEVGDMQQR